MIFLALVFALSFVVASVDVHNYSVESFYSPFENISGDINLTIVGEDYDDLITSNDGDEISLGEFLDRSGNLFTCSPPDCSKEYETSSGVVDKSFGVSVDEDSYVGVVVSGENVVVKSLDFKVESDFGVGAAMPLGIEFFESEDWRFSGFSDELLTKKWGCYDPTVGFEGAVIGDVFYCEMISVPDTKTMKVGAEIGGDDVANLTMTVFPETGTGASWFCNYNPNSEDGCFLSSGLDDIFSAGDYQVCVSAESSITGYKIYGEAVGDTCGFVHESGPSGSVKDYAIYAQGAKYASASLLSSADFSDEDIIEAANDLIVERYGGDCSDGCILPMMFSGVEQDVRVYDLLMTYTKNLELDSSDVVYDLEVAPVSVDFAGLLDLGSLGFSVSETMNYVLSFSGVELFSEFMEILPAPIILSVLPLDPPAGVPIRFYAGVDYGKNDSLTYRWDFGDGASETTDVPYATHAYADLSNYTLTLEVSAGGNLTSVKSFDVDAISPEVAVNSSLAFKKSVLESVVSVVAEFPAWYGGPLGELINVVFFEGELDRLEREEANAFVDADFVDIAMDLYALDVPAEIYVESFEGFSLLTQKADIDIEPVERGEWYVYT